MENNYKTIGRDKIKKIFEEGWSQIEFIEIVFREWAKLNQVALNKKYANEIGVSVDKHDIDKFSLWLVDNIYLQVYCNGSDSAIVKEFCVNHFGYQDGDFIKS